MGEAARATGVSVDTLRYYERAGVMPPVRRTSTGRRVYTRDDLGWTVFVLRLRATGMPLEEVRRYTRMVRDGQGTVPERRALLEEHRRTVGAAIAELQRAAAVLDGKIAHYAAAERGERLDCDTVPLDAAARIG
ncbi:MerR family transcriptional regulator [Phycicoccus sp. BSK3Z-2]|uniref:MerR family transcriptional regulator n=1 Tax=Phycicoccus avicenniae TaxID=2828860 RepID=A0A941DAS8_9MICO|nr:MerR family transcriptional regulator [Phycicoccus avicenniae]